MMLEPDDYTIGGETVPPTDIILPDTWHGIMDLPDDVAVRITDHHGSDFKLLHILREEWLEAVGNEHDSLSAAMLDASDCFQASLFDYVHGYYRSSISNLRSALELIAIGALGNLFPEDEVYLRWKDGSADLAFPACRRRLHRRLKSGYQGLLDFDGWVVEQYYGMCGYAHSRPRSTDSDLWESNGPVYNGRAIEQILSTQLFTYACCYLLIKIGRPKFLMPMGCAALFELDDHPWCSHARQSYVELYPV
jgi:hypothetical protein